MTIFRGVNADLLGYELSTPYETTNLTVSELNDIDQASVTEGLDAASLDDARKTVENLYAQAGTNG